MLLAQAASASSASFGAIAVAGVAALAVIALVVFVLTISFGYARRSRELEHAERMKAVEHGQPLDESSSPRAKFMHNAFWISFWLVALVPSTAFSAAASATGGGGGSVALAMVIWLSAAAASLGAVIGATVLMIRSRRNDDADDFGWKKFKAEKDLYA